MAGGIPLYDSKITNHNFGRERRRTNGLVKITRWTKFGVIAIISRGPIIEEKISTKSCRHGERSVLFGEFFNVTKKTTSASKPLDIMISQQQQQTENTRRLRIFLPLGVEMSFEVTLIRQQYLQLKIIAGNQKKTSCQIGRGTRPVLHAYLYDVRVRQKMKCLGAGGGGRCAYTTPFQNRSYV